MGIIREGFDGDVSAEWVPYTNVQRTVENGRLICSAGTIMGALIAPYKLTLNNPIEFDIAMVHDGTGMAHAGFWLCDETQKDWVRFAFQDNKININAIPNQNPNYVYNWQALFEKSVDRLTGDTRRLKVEWHSDTNASFFVDSEMIATLDIGFKAVYFAVFVYGATIAIDNLMLSSDVFVVQGNSLQDDGKASRYILINDWKTGDFIKKIVPSNTGGWQYVTDNNNPVLVTHVGEDGFAPQADGGIIPILLVE